MSDLVKVNVKSLKPDGYRRAGVALKQGENEIEVTPEQFKQMDADANLIVEAVDLDAAEQKVTKKAPAKQAAK